MPEYTSKKPALEKTVLAGYAYYTFVHAPQKDEQYGNKYKTDLVLENEDGSPFIYEGVNMLERAQEIGFELKTSQNIPGRYVRIQSKELINGKPRGPIPTVDKDKNPLSPEVLIGNGSVIKVQAIIYPWGTPKRGGVSALLDRVKVENLIPYVSKRGEDDFDFPHMRGKNKASEAEGFNDAPLLEE